MSGRDDFVALCAAAGLGDTPLVFSACGSHGPVVDLAQGRWPDGSEVLTTDRFYGASLAKQVTGAAIALMVQRGVLDADAPAGRYLVELPVWRDTITVRQMLHHLAGLPEAGDLERRIASAHWTNTRVLLQLRELATLPFTPGAEFHYSNAGYICLAAILESVSGLPFERFVQEGLFNPLELDGITMLEEGTSPPYRQSNGMGQVLPLSAGDGGLWTSAPAFARWLNLQNHDRLGICNLVQQPGCRLDGSLVDYGWGIGIGSFRGHRIFTHGGSWHGASAKALRCPELGLSIVTLAAGDVSAEVGALVEAGMDLLAGD